jgi:hypothetical protein
VADWRSNAVERLPPGIFAEAAANRSLELPALRRRSSSRRFGGNAMRTRLLIVALLG